MFVGGCAWIYALDQPNYDITPILDTVFADMEYAGMEGIEVMQTTLRPDNAVQRLAALAEKANGMGNAVGTTVSGGPPHNNAGAMPHLKVI
ncbi:MAG: hypothetical protein ACC645_12765 [Pirellulales bacterium]